MVGFDLDPELSLALRTSHDSQYFSESSGSSEQHATSTRYVRTHVPSIMSDDICLEKYFFCYALIDDQVIISCKIKIHLATY